MKYNAISRRDFTAKCFIQGHSLLRTIIGLQGSRSTPTLSPDFPIYLISATFGAYIRMVLKPERRVDQMYHKSF